MQSRWSDYILFFSRIVFYYSKIKKIETCLTNIVLKTILKNKSHNVIFKVQKNKNCFFLRQCRLYFFWSKLLSYKKLREESEMKKVKNDFIELKERIQWGLYRWINHQNTISWETNRPTTRLSWITKHLTNQRLNNQKAELEYSVTSVGLSLQLAA